jgi:integrase
MRDKIPAWNNVKRDYNHQKNQWKMIYSAPSIIVGEYSNGKPKYKTPRKVVSLNGILPVLQQWNNTYDPALKQKINLSREQIRSNKMIEKRYIIPLEVDWQRDLTNHLMHFDQHKQVFEKFADWIDDYASVKPAKNTRVGYHSLANRIRESGDPYFTELTSKWINEFHKTHAKRVIAGVIKQSTARNYWEDINFLLYEAERDEKLTDARQIHNGVFRVEKGEARVGDYFTQEELKKLDTTEFSRDVLKRAFLFCCWSGLRFTEAQNLKWSDLTEDNGSTLVRIQGRKNKVGERIKLSSNALRYLGTRLEDYDSVFMGLKYDHANQYLTIFANKAGINREVKTHDARRTCAALIWQKTKNTEMVRVYLGHSQLVQTNRYLANFLGKNYALTDANEIFPDW